MAKILLFFLSISLLQEREANSGTLTVRISNLESGQGCLRIAVYDGESFLEKNKEVSRKMIPLRTAIRDLEIELPGLGFGQYALALYHDINDNGKLDANLLGIPTEPYAFSNNPAVKWRSPDYVEAQFEFFEDGQVVEVVLKRWKSR